MKNKIKDPSFLVIFCCTNPPYFLVISSVPPPTPPGGLRILVRGVPPGSLNLNPTSDQKVPFSLPFLDLGSVSRKSR